MKSLFAIFFGFSQLFAGSPKLVLKTMPGENWSSAELDSIREAANTVFERIHTYKVAQCAYRSAYKEKKDKLRNSWGRRIPVLNKADSVTIVIHKKKLSPDRLGQAKVGVAKVDWRNYQLNNLEIQLSEDYIKKDLKRLKKGNKSATQRWIMVIAHEIGHNLGYRHGFVPGGTAKDYYGYFVTELGHCVLNNGKHGSSKK